MVCSYWCFAVFIGNILLFILLFWKSHSMKCCIECISLSNAIAFSGPERKTQDPSSDSGQGQLLLVPVDNDRWEPGLVTTSGYDPKISSISPAFPGVCGHQDTPNILKHLRGCWLVIITKHHLPIKPLQKMKAGIVPMQINCNLNVPPACGYKYYSPWLQFFVF